MNKAQAWIPVAEDTTQHQNLDTLGVSVYHLEHIFLQEKVCTTANSLLSRSSTIYEIENLQGPPSIIRNTGIESVCPLDGLNGAAYVHCLQGEDHVGEATHMLSYCWEYTIGDIVDTLTDFCHTNNLDPKRTYIWICCLCVNQHRVAAQSALQKSGMLTANLQVDFFTIFGERVKRIGHVLAMMTPWHSPVYLTRVWCIYELFVADIHGCKVDIVMSPTEKRALEQDIINEGRGINGLYQVLGKTKVQDAQADVESDRVEILQKIESMFGYHVLNNQVNELLRRGMQQVLKVIFKEKKNTNDSSYVDFCNSVGVILRLFGEHDAAMDIFVAAMTTCVAVLGNHIETATTYNNIGEALLDKGDHNGAMESFQKALKIQEPVLMDDPSTAIIYENIGLVYEKLGYFDAAIKMYLVALNIQEEALGEHLSTANSYMNIVSALRAMGEIDSSMEMWKKALLILKAVLGDHPDIATSYIKIGSEYDASKEYDGAIDMYEKALLIQRAVLGEHPSTAKTYSKIGLSLHKKGDLDGAMINYNFALKIQEAVLGDHLDTANTYSIIGDVFYRQKNVEKAVEVSKRALNILDVLGGHPWTDEITGAFLRVQGDYVGAARMVKKALFRKK